MNETTSLEVLRVKGSVERQSLIIIIKKHKCSCIRIGEQMAAASAKISNLLVSSSPPPKPKKPFIFQFSFY